MNPSIGQQQIFKEITWHRCDASVPLPISLDVDSGADAQNSTWYDHSMISEQLPVISSSTLGKFIIRTERVKRSGGLRTNFPEGTCSLTEEAPSSDFDVPSV